MVLALEVSFESRPAADLKRVAAPHPRHERSQSPVGAAHSRRTVDARHQGRTVNCGQIHDTTATSAEPELESLPRNHAAGIAAMDLLVVPTIRFRLLYAFVILRHDRRGS
jgi:hypothetical protein